MFFKCVFEFTMRVFKSKELYDVCGKNFCTESYNEKDEVFCSFRNDTQKYRNHCISWKQKSVNEWKKHISDKRQVRFNENFKNEGNSDANCRISTSMRSSTNYTFRVQKLSKKINN